MKRIIHDLRSPLARAKTLAKLLQEASPGEREECLRLLLEALEELEERLSEIQSSSLG
jgi:signal transduction histidine kinase